MDKIAVKPIPTPIPEEDRARFAEKVLQKGPDECRPWLGATTSSGRGQFKYAGAIFAAPRIAKVLAGDPPRTVALMACHTCDNPNCVNPEHLWWGSAADNVRDMIEKGRNVSRAGWQKALTHCKRGHPLSGDNVVKNNGGGRKCETCRKLHGIRWRLKNGKGVSEDALNFYRETEDPNHPLRKFIGEDMSHD